MKKIISILLTMFLLVCVPVTAFAAETGDSIEKIDVSVGVSDESKNLGGVLVTDENGKTNPIIKNGDIVVFTATPRDGAKFDKWVITGEYEIVEGSLNSSVIKVRVSSNVNAVASFVSVPNETTTVPPATTVPPTTNGSSTSPDTGSNTVVPAGIAIAVLGIAGIACVTAIKKKERV